MKTNIFVSALFILLAVLLCFTSLAFAQGGIGLPQNWINGPNGGIYYLGSLVGIGGYEESGVILKLKNPSGWENVIKFEDNVSSTRIQVFSGNGGLINFYTDNDNFVKFAIKNDRTISWNDDQSYLSPEQGGSIELNSGSVSNNQPFVDFHFGKGYLEDFNTRIINSGDFRMDFATKYNGYSTVMTIKEDRVGINTSTPDANYKLSVNGKIRAKEIKVEANWSDFVFKPEYNLLSLNEVEAFIKENGHLPEIPSEQEVTENGVELGSMTSKLLQKIEELTLYIIEQQKEIEKLKIEKSKK